MDTHATTPADFEGPDTPPRGRIPTLDDASTLLTRTWSSTGVLSVPRGMRRLLARRGPCVEGPASFPAGDAEAGNAWEALSRPGFARGPLGTISGVHPLLRRD